MCVKQNAQPHLFALRTNLSAASDGEFFEGPDVVNQQVHKSQLVTETNQDVQAWRMERYAVTLLLEFLILFQWTAMQQLTSLQTASCEHIFLFGSTRISAPGFSRRIDGTCDSKVRQLTS